ncbi:MAG: 2-C-methyl-D-erythritol 4-phosphate cytidylyltransferase [Bacteroidaceae bacterium]|nr:2-C-methyl-D-erythritol 4-phosphate cytidylyltransferase [Bacteroidaceae bacterium]
MKKYIIIVAGGKGLRMGGEIPKQFLPIGGKPVLMRTMEAFHAYDAEIQIVLVLPVAQQAYWKELCDQYTFALPYRLADGGETRFHSVKNGLDTIPTDEEALVGVHDGVRPFVSAEVIARCYAEAARVGAVVPVTDVVETVRHLEDGGGSTTVNRDEYKLVQTPQVFSLALLKQAYAQPYVPAFTDDASVVEALGHEVTLVQGNRENIKITTPFDLVVGRSMC